MPLTEANIEKLVHEQDGDSPMMGKSGSLNELHSNRAHNAHSLSNNRPSTLTRPGLQEHHFDSEQTITERINR
jgi:hypothetical protein